MDANRSKVLTAFANLAAVETAAATLRQLDLITEQQYNDYIKAFITKHPEINQALQNLNAKR